MQEASCLFDSEISMTMLNILQRWFYKKVNGNLRCFISFSCYNTGYYLVWKYSTAAACRTSDHKPTLLVVATFRAWLGPLPAVHLVVLDRGNLQTQHCLSDLVIWVALFSVFSKHPSCLGYSLVVHRLGRCPPFSKDPQRREWLGSFLQFQVSLALFALPSLLTWYFFPIWVKICCPCPFLWVLIW